MSDPANTPALDLRLRKDGTYRLYDAKANQNVPMSEAETVDRLRAQMNAGHKWEFRYTYLNLTPMHVSFRVEFGTDGRVAEVKPIYGWD